MKTPSKTELIRKIDALQGVCDKTGIRDLVAEITGVDLSGTFRTGQRFAFTRAYGGHRGDEYILAQLNPCEVIAVNLRTGNTRTGRPITIGNNRRITSSELRAIFGCPGKDGPTLIN